MSPPHEVRDGHGHDMKGRNSMRLINAADVKFLSTNELRALIREITESLQEMSIESPEYQATIASLTIVKRALQARRPVGPKF